MRLTESGNISDAITDRNIVYMEFLHPKHIRNGYDEDVTQYFFLLTTPFFGKESEAVKKEIEHRNAFLYVTDNGKFGDLSGKFGDLISKTYGIASVSAERGLLTMKIGTFDDEQIKSMDEAKFIASMVSEKRFKFELSRMPYCYLNMTAI